MKGGMEKAVMDRACQVSSVIQVFRWMLGIAVAPALLQIAGLTFLPESPRSLLLVTEKGIVTGLKILMSV